MRIFNIEDQEITSPDLRLGYLKNEKRFVTHHPAIAAVAEQFHYKEIASYPNGGKDFIKVVDTPGVDAVAAWDEYEDILRYIPYTDVELAQLEENRKRTPAAQIAELQRIIVSLL